MKNGQNLQNEISREVREIRNLPLRRLSRSSLIYGEFDNASVMGDVKKSSSLRSHALPAAFRDPETRDSDSTSSPPNSPVIKRLPSSKTIPSHAPVAEVPSSSSKNGAIPVNISHSADEILPYKRGSNSQPELRPLKNGTPLYLIMVYHMQLIVGVIFNRDWSPLGTSRTSDAFIDFFRLNSLSSL